MVVAIRIGDHPVPLAQMLIRPAHHGARLGGSRHDFALHLAGVASVRASLHVGCHQAVNAQVLGSRLGDVSKRRRDEQRHAALVPTVPHLVHRRRAIAPEQHRIMEAAHEGTDLAGSAFGQRREDDLAGLVLAIRQVQDVAGAPPTQSQRT